MFFPLFLTEKEKLSMKKVFLPPYINMVPT